VDQKTAILSGFFGLYFLLIWQWRGSLDDDRALRRGIVILVAAIYSHLKVNFPPSTLVKPEITATKMRFID